VEATARGLAFISMAGFDPEKRVRSLEFPRDGSYRALAIGYRAIQLPTSAFEGS